MAASKTFEQVRELRTGPRTSETDGHPVLGLTDDELRAIFAGVDPTASSVHTATNVTEFPKICCDGTRVCCS